MGDELGKGFGRNRRIDDHDFGRAQEACDWRHVADEIEAELVVQGRVDRVRQADKAERIAVGRRAYERLGGNVGPGARPVLNDDGLAQPFLQPLTDQAPDDIGPAAGGEAYEQAHRTRRIGLCPSISRTRHAR